jgi:hypothetical protein
MRRKGTALLRILGMLSGMVYAGVAGADPGVQPAVQRVMACVRANVPQSSVIKKVELVDTDHIGSVREFRGEVFARQHVEPGKPSLANVMLRINAPEDLGGAAYLVRQGLAAAEDEMYLFLPSLRRVRRITGGAENGNNALLGTSLSYDDFRQMQTVFSGTPHLEAPAQLEQRAMYVIALKPEAPRAGSYSLVRAWVDQKTCVPLKAEFYEDAALRKRLTASAADLRQYGSTWYLSDMLMQDLAKGSSTRLHIDGMVSGADLSNDYFQPNTFYRAGGR